MSSYESHDVMKHLTSPSKEKESSGGGGVQRPDERGLKHISANYFNKSFASVSKSMSNRSKPMIEEETPHLITSAPPVILPSHPYLSPPSARLERAKEYCQPNYAKNYWDPNPLFHNASPRGHDFSPLVHALPRKPLKRTCCQSRAFLIALLITALLIVSISLLSYFFFPRIPSTQLLVLRQLTPSENTLKFEDSAIRFLIEYESVIAINSTNPITWQIGPLHVLGFYAAKSVQATSKLVRQKVGEGHKEHVTIPPRTQSEHAFPFTVDYRIKTKNLPVENIKDLNTLKLFSKQSRNSTGSLTSLEFNVKQLATDIKDDAVLMDIIQKCSSIGKGDRMLSLEFDIEFGHTLINWTGWKPSFQIQHKILCPFPPAMLDTLATLALVQRL